MKKSAEKSIKRKIGRPRKTLKDFNLPDNWKEIIYELSAQGCSDVEIRAHFLMLGGKFSQVTWDALKERESEFLLTVKQGKVLCQAWWEKQSRVHLTRANFQTGSWYANMKNRFGWKDRQEIEHSLGDSLFEKYNDLSDDDLDKRYLELNQN